MKTYFDFNLNGREWFRPFISYWVVFLLLYSPFLVLIRRAQSDPGAAFAVALLELVQAVAIVAVSAVFAILFLRILLPKISIGGNSFSFRGSIRKYFGMNLAGMLLTIVTGSVYFPWYLRRVFSYLVSETGFKGVAPEFLGKGGRLFKYYLLGVLIPIVAVVVVSGVVMGLTAAAGNADAVRAEAAGMSLIIGVVALLIPVPFFYLLYKWYANIKWNDVTIIWETSFWPSCGVLLGQILLSVIAVSVYWPAGFLRIYRYFAGRTAFSRGGTAAGRLGFDGSIGKGFGLLWGQSLLCIVTLGIYIPWAYAKIGRWLLGATYYEESGSAPTRIVPEASSDRNRESGNTLTGPSFSSTLPVYTP
jgi:hypothetical protein